MLSSDTLAGTHLPPPSHGSPSSPLPALTVQRPASVRAPKPRRRPPGTVNPARYAIQYSKKLTPWMCAYAEWLTSLTERLTRTALAAQASRLAGHLIGADVLRMLEARPDFRAYLEELAAGPVQEARAKYLNRLPKYIDGYDEAFEGARAGEDWKLLAQIAESAVDRVAPKKSETLVAPQVTIVLSAKQQAAIASLDEPPAVVDYEVLPPEAPAGEQPHD